MNFETKIKHLVSGLLDENLSEDEAKELDLLLKENEEARAIYRRMLDMEMTLRETAEFEEPFKDLPKPEEMPDKFRKTRFQLHIYQALVACLILALVITFSSQTTQLKVKEVVKEVPVNNPSLEVYFASLIETSSDVKWLGEQKDLGDLISGEKLELESGSIILRYEHGAEIKLQAPVSYELKSLSYAKITYGNLAARIPEAAQGFTVDSPKASVVDLGTEFSMKVDKNGVTEVFVFEGEVETSLIGEDGNTFKNARLLAYQGAKISDDLELINEQDQNSGFVRVSAKDNSLINISPLYVEAVKRDRPVGYWRFEEGREFVNERSELYRVDFKNGLVSLNGALNFEKDAEHYLQVNTPISGINSNGYSVEFWVNPEEYRNEMSLLSLVLPDNPTWHLLYSSLTGKAGSLKHKPFNVRMSSRFPATNGYGTNCFSNKTYQTREWNHYAFVKDNQSLKIYINGELANSVKTLLGSDDQAYQLCFGRIDPERSMRYYVGQLDELAIYNYPLQAEQIKEHFEAQVK